MAGTINPSQGRKAVKNMRVLLVEDDERLAASVARGLREQSYAVDVAKDGEEALYQAEINRYDLVILDVLLPHKNGFEVCRELRARGAKTPVLMLTARGGVDDRVTGLDSGADDYLVKPFELRELLARMRALLRRPQEVRPAVLRVADLELDTAGHTAARGGRRIRLTAREYALLELLVSRAGQMLDREEIAEHVWDENYDPFSNVIEVYIRRLRRKIDDGHTLRLIHTRRGAGYVLCEGVPDASEEGAEGD
jgi:DNA-binding response OmpR family regulator